MGRLDNYVPVNVRLMQFRKDHGINGAIQTTLLPLQESGGGVGGIAVQAVVIIGGQVVSTGTSLCTELGEEKTLEKAETVAVGRALALAGYSADSAIASAEEMEDFESGSEETTEETSTEETTNTTNTTGTTKAKKLGFGARRA